MNLRMINTTDEPDHRTDAQIAADWAREALAEGRYELGAALANIARQAARVEARSGAARMVPLLGTTRNESPAPVSTVPAHLYDEIERSGAIPRPEAVDEQGATFRRAETAVVALGPTGNGNADVPGLGDAGEAQTELFGRVDEPDANRALPSARCIAVIEQWGPDQSSRTTSPCHAVVFWEPGQMGDENHPPITAGWRHLNPELDQHHAPVAQQG